MTCNTPTCRRARLSHFAYCPAHLDEVIAAWLGQPVRLYCSATTRAPETNPAQMPSRTPVQVEVTQAGVR